MELIPEKFKSAMRLSIGIISDTHGLLRPEAMRALQGSDVVLHAGDVGDEMILEQLEAIAPVYTVRGNMDYQPWCGSLPSTRTIILGEICIYMIHDIAHVDRSKLTKVSMVVYGHSHRPEIVERDHVIYLNPGSAGPKRFSLPVTLAKLDWEKGQEKLTPQLIQLI